MTPERWKKLDALFHEVLELQGEARAAHLAKACGDDEQLRTEAERLLAAHEREGSFIDSPIFVEAAELTTSDRYESPLGRSIGPYQVISQLGRGGMGEVYLAEDRRLGRKVALKLLRKEFTRDAERARRFEQEARAASSLNHPNIVTIHEIGQVDSTHYIVTEFVEGETLRQQMTESMLGIDAALDVAAQVASALAAAHAAGIVHRDIKPENVMVRPDGLVKVLDFGLAKLTEPSRATVETNAPASNQSLTEPGQVMGTPHYMSPEQARGAGVDSRSDIFSFGVMLYELVSGRRPFEGGTTSDVIAAILQNEPPPLTADWPETPRELERIVNKALRKERDERYQGVKDLLLDLKSLRQESNSGASLAAADHRMKRPRLLTSPLMLALAALVILLVVVGGLVGWYFRRESTPPVWRPVPLTSYPGLELNPALSPDGNQVAFSWNGEKQDNFDIYIKLIGSGSPLQLTKDPAEDISPAWSPDGRTLAFLRRLGGGRKELLLIPALGGHERKLAETLIVDLDNSHLPALAWSPDGRWLAVSHREGEDPAEGLFLVSALTGEKRRLTRPPSLRGDFMPAFSPDGRTLAFSRLTGYSTREEVYLLSLSGDFKPAGEAQRLKTDVRWARHPVWTRDGRHILYISETNPNLPEQRELRMTAVSGSGSSERVTLPEGNISELSLGRHLVYTQGAFQNDIWRAEIPPPGGQASQPQLLISSTRRDAMPRYSPDGKKIAFSSTRSGSQEIWISDADGSNPVQLTSFGGPLVGPSNWSPDGERLVFHARPEGQADLFTIPATGGAPKRLTMDPSDDSAPSYSHDGRRIYFASARSGQFEVWKMPAEGGDATRITSGGGGMPIESPDGKTLYYEHIVREKGIWKVPVQGGEAVQVTSAYKGMFSYAVAADGIFYVPAADSPHQGLIQFLSFSTGQSRPVVVSDRPIGQPNISPDRRFLVFSQPAQRGSDLMLIENFVVR